MGSALVEILIILGLILVNGFLAMAEIAVVSARKVRLQARAERGDPGAAAALELANAPGRFLSSVQIGITLVGILAGAFGGATLAEELAGWLDSLGVSARYSEAAGVGLVVVGITYFSLVIGELAPKQIALLYPERVASLAARPMRLISWLTSPVVRVLSASTAFVVRAFGIKPGDEPAVSEDEVKRLIDQGTELGVFEPIEDTIVDQVFRLGDRRVISLTTPRPEVVWLDLEDLPEINWEKIRRSEYRYFPVARGKLDNLIGVVNAGDLLGQLLGGEEIDLERAVRPALIVPENTPAFVLLERFRESGAEAAVVMDEYGGIQGLATLRDVLEALVGDLPDAEDIADPDVSRREDGSWLIDGMLPADEFRSLFNLAALPGEGGEFQTVGGFVLSVLGAIPEPGDHFEYAGLRVEVVDMDGRRIDKIMVEVETDTKGDPVEPSDWAI